MLGMTRTLSLLEQVLLLLVFLLLLLLLPPTTTRLDRKYYPCRAFYSNLLKFLSNLLKFLSAPFQIVFKFSSLPGGTKTSRVLLLIQY